MSDIFLSPKPSELLWQAREVIKNVDERPHLVVRIDISGAYFPHRAAEPFVRIVTDRDQVVFNWFAEVADDNRGLVGYFPTDLPGRGTIEFGYGGKILGRAWVEFESKAVKKLDRTRLAKEVVEVSAEYLKTKFRR
jgi:hypothetical protein